MLFGMIDSFKLKIYTLGKFMTRLLSLSTASYCIFLFQIKILKIATTTASGKTLKLKTYLTLYFCRQLHI